jgi:hemoglobin
MRVFPPPGTPQKRLSDHDTLLAVEINSHFISDLVDNFYEHVRAHPVLGPVFDDAIADQWDEHLATLKRFWSSIALHDGSYSGRPVPAHMPIAALTPEMFDTWLALFDQTLGESTASSEVREFFNGRARQIAKSLKLNVFCKPAG